MGARHAERVGGADVAATGPVRPAANRAIVRKILALTTALAVLGVAPAAAAPSPAKRSIGCTDSADVAERLVIRVDGQKATGHYAVPDSAPKVALIVGHGYGHTSYSWVKHLRWAAANGMAAAAMDYRGLTFLPDENKDGLPNSRGWPAKTGAEDLLAAARLLDRACPASSGSSCSAFRWA